MSTQAMNNLSYDDGFQKVTVNNDPNRVIRWNPTDINFVDRFLEFQDWIDNTFRPKIKNLGTLETNFDNYEQGTIENLGKELNEALDKAFSSNVSEIAFAGVNPISPVANGNLLFANFLEALTPLIQKSINDFSAARKKYTDAAKGANANHPAAKSNYKNN